MENSMRNKLIVFEGIDGTGKTTLSINLAHHLSSLGIRAMRYEDVEDPKGGFNLIKPFIQEKVSIDASFFFYLASAIHKSGIIRNLLNEQWVICDRYIYSTLAYHKAKGADLTLLPSIDTFPIIFPDFYFLLRTREPVRMRRIKQRSANNAGDLEPKKRGGFLDRMEKHLAEYHPTIIDNSSMDVSQTTSRILKAMNFNL